MNRTTRLKRLLPGLALALCLPLQSCFTAGLWASHTPGKAKAVLTPFSLALDTITLPAQLAFLNGGHHHHGGARHSPRPRLRPRRR